MLDFQFNTSDLSYGHLKELNGEHKGDKRKQIKENR